MMYVPCLLSKPSSFATMLQGLESGSVDYVKKPFHRKELLSRIRAQIRNRWVSADYARPFYTLEFFRA